MKRPYRLAQSLIEYVMIFVIVAAAVGVTYKYIYRAINARLKNTQDELNYSRSVEGVEADEYNDGSGDKIETSVGNTRPGCESCPDNCRSRVVATGRGGPSAGNWGVEWYCAPATGGNTGGDTGGNTGGDTGGDTGGNTGGCPAGSHRVCHPCGRGDTCCNCVGN